MPINLTMKQTNEVNDIEVEVRYQKLTDELRRLERAIKSVEVFLIAETENEKEKIKIPVCNIYYFESVDKKTFLYTENGVYRIKESLGEIDSEVSDHGFTRISKTVVVNVKILKCIRNIANSRLEATLMNGEKVLISRKYLKSMREMIEHGGKR